MTHASRSYWRKLDNAAKLFPAMSNRKDTRVFRFYCELKEEIQEEKLQQALDKLLLKYPMFLSVMRKGLFWHYLEKSDLRPVVCPEYKEPCSNLYVRDKKDLLFEVTYHHNRINFEVYHALTDGTGAAEFVRELVQIYLSLVHPKDTLSHDSHTKEKGHSVEHERDSFAQYYTKDFKRQKRKKTKAYQIRRPNKELGNLQITELEVPLEALQRRCRELGVSMTVFVTTVFLCAIHEEMSHFQEMKPVVMMVPVNLRKFFPSESMLNFFNFIEPGYKFGEGNDSFDDVLEHVKKDFLSKLTKEKMAQRMNEYMALEVNPILRFAPLELKNICINAGAKTSSWDTTAIFSNMGAVEVAEEYAPYIQRFGVYTSTPKMELCMCSFQDLIYFGFTSRYDSTKIKQNFMNILKKQHVISELLEPDYPENVEERFPERNVLKGFTYFCMITALISLGMDYLSDSLLQVSIWITGGVASMWLTFMIGFLKRHNLLKNAMWQLLIITLGCIVWDVETGWHRWSVDFVLPITSIVILVTMLAIIRVRKHPPREYLIYLIMASVYGALLPTALALSKIVHIFLPTILCVGFCFLFLLDLIWRKSREFKEEMIKKFHF